MEVKIKQGKEMIDATIEMVDGVMVVSPKGKICEFNDGDVLASDKSHVIYIFKENVSEDGNLGYIGINNNKELKLTESEWGNLIFRLATEEEKKKLFDRLAEEGYSWDAEKKQPVKLKWKPKFEEVYYTPSFNGFGFERYVCRWDEDNIESQLYKMGWVFKTEQECQEFCKRLNEAINQVKP